MSFSVFCAIVTAVHPSFKHTSGKRREMSRWRYLGGECTASSTSQLLAFDNGKGRVSTEVKKKNIRIQEFGNVLTFNNLLGCAGIHFTSCLHIGKRWYHNWSDGHWRLRSKCLCRGKVFEDLHGLVFLDCKIANFAHYSGVRVFHV